jgi:hypothetical protein
MKPLGLIVLSYLFSSVSPFAPPSHLKTRLPALQMSAPPVEFEDAVVVGDPMFLDEEAMLAARPDGALAKSEMIQIVKDALLASGGIGLPEAMLAPDFSFEGPVVGPFSKTEFLDAIGRVDFKGGFSEFKNEFYGFSVDPLEGDRVWYTARGRGINDGPFPTAELPATMKEVVNPPQVCSMTIDHATRRIKRYTIGYVVDRQVGNTGGLGGLYGIMYAIGRPLPFPEALPWRPSLPYQAFQTIGGFLEKLGS